MRLLAAVVLLLALGVSTDKTVVTRDGKVHEGTVTREGTDVLVTTAKGTVRLPATSVVSIFTTWPEARRLADARFGEATKLFEEASAKSERDALRRRQLIVSLDICAETRDLLELLEKRAPGAERDALAALKLKLFQFMRTLRDAKGATAQADGLADALIDPVKLQGLGLTIEALPEGERATEITDDLGPGQGSALKELASEEAGVRAAAAGKLISPPAPHALAALAKAMQVEKDKDALAAIVLAVARLDVGRRLKTDFAWAHADEDTARRYAVIALARRLPSRTACDFLGDCFRTSPPSDNRMRATFASAFRKLRPASIEELRETFTKSKSRDVQLEALRQLGMMRDRLALPTIKLALGASRDHLQVAFNAIERTGGVAIPLVMEMMGDGNDEIRRFARLLAQRITREEIDGVSELQKWFAQYRRHIDDDEKDFWKAQEERDFPVGPDEFLIFDRKLPNMKDKRE